MVHGPQAALDLVETLATDPSLDRYHLLPSVRADLLLKLSRTAEAKHHFEQAAAAPPPAKPSKTTSNCTRRLAPERVDSQGCEANECAG